MFCWVLHRNMYIQLSNTLVKYIFFNIQIFYFQNPIVVIYREKMCSCTDIKTEAFQIVIMPQRQQLFIYLF